MEDVMFVHKSKLLALGFAAAMVIGLAAGPAQADRRKAYQEDDYCSAPEVCNQRQIGIIQKTRDGVNYFYGGSDVPAPQVNYIYLRDDDIGQPIAEPIRTSDLYPTSYAAPLSNHQFRKDHWKKKNFWKWKKRHPGSLDLPGMNGGVNYKGP
jgi:hypothetical protein